MDQSTIKIIGHSSVPSLESVSSTTISEAASCLGLSNYEGISNDKLWTSAFEDLENMAQTLSDSGDFNQSNGRDTLESIKVKLTGGDKSENRLELLTVLNILSISKELRSHLNLQPSEESFLKEKSLCFSLVRLFKYHFRLPLQHPNFGFKKFGFLLALEKNPLIISLLHVTSIACNLDDRSVRKLKRITSLLLSLSVMNQTLFKSIATIFQDDKNMRLLESISDSGQLADTFDHNGPLSVWRCFHQATNFESSDGCKNDFNLGCSVGNKTLKSTFYGIQKLETIIKAEEKLSQKDPYALMSLITSYFTCEEYRELIIVYLFYHGDLLNVISKAFCEYPKQIEELVAYFFRDISAQIVWLFPKKIRKEMGLESVVKQKCEHTLYMISEQSFDDTECVIFIPIFELLNQNFKLSLEKETGLVACLVTSYQRIDEYLDSEEQLTEIVMKMDDLGCTLTLDSLLSYSQLVISKAVTDICSENTIKSVRLPDELITSFGFDSIPPLARDSAMMQANKFYNQKVSLLTELTSYSRRKEIIGMLCKSLESILGAKQKIGRILAGREDEFEDRSERNEDGVYDLEPGHKLASFKEMGQVRYRLAYRSISIRLKSDMAALIAAENMKEVQDTEANVLSEYLTVEIRQASTIYGEIGILSLFRELLGLCENDIRVVKGVARVLANSLPEKGSGSVVENSTIASNMIRLFVEEFDDGKSPMFKKMINFLKEHPSSLKPKKRVKGTAVVDIRDIERQIY